MHLFSMVLIIMSLNLSSCKPEDNGLPIPGEHPDQLFSPIINSPTDIPLSTILDNVGETVTVSWLKTPKATYEVEYSRDSLLFANELVSVTTDTLTNIKLTGLDANTTYSFRVRAISKDPTIKNSNYSACTFKTPFFTIFTNTNVYNTTLTTPPNNGTVTLTWSNTMDVSNIVQASTKSNHVLTSAEKTAGSYAFTGIMNTQADTFKIYRNNVLRGIAYVNNILVTYNYQISGMPNTTIRVNAGTSFAKPTTPVTTGKTFVNWYKEAACTNVFVFGTVVKADLTVYAKWNP